MGQFIWNILYRPNRVWGLDEFLEPNYSYFSGGHIMLLVLGFLILGAVAVLSFRKKAAINKVFIALSILISLCAATLITYSIISGIYNVEWYLPLHICNVFIIIMPLACIFRNKFRTFFMEYFVFAGFLGFLLATTFPMTTMLYFPPLHIVSILSWFHHVIIGALSVYLVCSGNFKFTNYRWYRPMSMIGILVALSIVANYFLGTNFLFMNMSRVHFPISAFVEVLGTFAVPIVLILLGLAAYSIQVCVKIYERIKIRTIISFIKWLEPRINNEGLKKFLQETTVEQLFDIDYMQSYLKKLNLRRVRRFCRLAYSSEQKEAV
ncbi:MAG: YwaF family protein [Firmicutes bacterium]|nr:YwaF family protein [Bacillota bacterium]